MNSACRTYLARILCPTINHNKGDIALLPVPYRLLTDKRLRALGEHAVSVVLVMGEEYDETTPIVHTPYLGNGTRRRRLELLTTLSTRIDD